MKKKFEAKSYHNLYIEEIAPIFFFLNFFKESFELFITEYLFLDIISFRYRCTVCRILCDEAFSDRRIQGFVNHHVDLSHYAVGKLVGASSVRLDSTFLFDLVIEFLKLGGCERGQLFLSYKPLHLVLGKASVAIECAFSYLR